MPEYDPYRYYTPPEPSGRSRRGTPTGRDILRATWRLLRQDRSMIGLAVLGSLAQVVAFVALFVPSLFLLGGHLHSGRTVVAVSAAIGGFPATFVAFFFQAAMVIGAFQRADGIAPTLNGVLVEAWRFKRKIISWSFISTTFGLAVRTIEERFGFFGAILGFLGGLTWAIASFFVIPVLIAQGVGPIDALKQSAGVVRTTWGTSVRTTLRFGGIQIALMIIPGILVGVGFAQLSDPTRTSAQEHLSYVLIAVGISALFLIAAALGAVSNYAEALIYRYAIGRPVPGLDPALIAGAFVPRRRRGRSSR